MPKSQSAEILNEFTDSYGKANNTPAYIGKKKKSFTKSIRGQSAKARAASKVRV